MQRRSIIAIRKSERIALIPARTYPPPTLTLVSPSTFDEDGGEAAALAGSGFLDTDPAVYFGSSRATGVAVSSDRALTCTTPGHALGAVTVVVRTMGGDASLANGATYVPGAAAFRILMETGDALLMETGDALRTE